MEERRENKKRLNQQMKEAKPKNGKSNGKTSDRKDLILPADFVPENIFILPVNNALVFPTMVAPINVSEQRFINTVEESIRKDRFIGILLTKDSVKKNTQSKDLYQFGVAAKIVKRLKMPDGSINLLVHGLRRFRVKEILSERPHIVAKCGYVDEKVENSKEMDALARTVIRDVKKLSESNPFFTDEMKLAMINAPNAGVVADLVVFALSLPKDQAQKYLEIESVKERFQDLLLHLSREQDVADLQRKISDDVNSKLNTMQREFFLKEQLKSIRRELGYEEDDRSKSTRTFREKIKAAKMPAEIEKIVMREVEKFETLSEQSPEYNVARTYLETICELPWSVETEDNLNMAHAEEILEKDHYGLEKVKDRILEFLAVRALKKERAEERKKPRQDGAPTGLSQQASKGSIICLVGPPGVGKTSIGKSIARSLGRNFYRFSLGGMRDEAEIKGHRRTYIGALPGKVIQAMKRVGTKNPVIMLDEIDKLGKSYQGDPASALLEVLDPEQNDSFIDHYLDIPFDLSKALFVATANTTATIPSALLDRMEVIEIPGYTLEEKEQIAKRYVLPKVLKEHGLRKNEFSLSAKTLKRLLLDYAREPGMRSVQQLLARIARKAAANLLRSRSSRKKRTGPIRVRESDLQKWLGPPRFYNEVNQRLTTPGVVVGLAWTAMGGDILFIEAKDLPGSGQLKLTGQMGEVMSESANIAWSYIKDYCAKNLGLTQEDYKKRDIHVHIPAGAIPKDGPSAGVTMATALLSLFSKKVSKQKLAMTGELSLTGKVLPVGGIKEKLLAAKRAGITDVILPELNKKDLDEIPKRELKGLKIYFASRVEQVFDIVLGVKENHVRSQKKSKAKKRRIVKKNEARANRSSPVRKIPKKKNQSTRASLVGRN